AASVHPEPRSNSQINLSSILLCFEALASLTSFLNIYDCLDSVFKDQLLSIFLTTRYTISHELNVVNSFFEEIYTIENIMLNCVLSCHTSNLATGITIAHG